MPSYKVQVLGELFVMPDYVCTKLTSPDRVVLTLDGLIFVFVDLLRKPGFIPKSIGTVMQCVFG